MNLISLIKIAIKSLLRNKGRSFLTMLGIIIGIASVIIMVSLGQASTLNVKEELSSMGSNMIVVMPASQMRGGVNMGNSNTNSLDQKDYIALKEKTKYVKDLSPMVNSSAQLVYGANNHPGVINGVSAAYLNIRKYDLQSGIMFTDDDIKRYSKVCIIGQTVVEALFPNNEDPIGKIIRFGSIPMKVIGVLQSKGENQMGQDQDDVVIVPYTTVQKRFMGITHYNMLFASAISEEESELAATEMTHILRKTHHISSTDEDNFEIRTQEELLSSISSITKLLTILLSAIASISLIVGGIGVMNIMYVTVTERTKEIGLRMAIGAKSSSVLYQFLAESIILCIIGGIIGIILGIFFSYMISSVLSWAHVISKSAIVISFLVCAITGIFFGWYPAKKAANLDPITALRYE